MHGHEDSTAGRFVSIADAAELLGLSVAETLGIVRSGELGGDFSNAEIARAAFRSARTHLVAAACAVAGATPSMGISATAFTPV